MRVDDPNNEVGACARCQQSPLDFDFTFAYQPIVSARARTIVAHEALVRGRSGESASSVLSQVNSANRYAFDQLCRVKAIEGAAKLHMSGQLSINFLPNAIEQPEACIQQTLQAASRCGFPLSQIIFEVTESEAILDRSRLLSIVRKYREYGFMTAIDDFGAGYSGLSLFADFQPDLLKIDMALIRDVHRIPAKQEIVKAIVAMCRNLGVAVLAEGIETPQERDYLYDAGIDLMQGFLFSRPQFESLGTVESSAWVSQA